MEPSATNAAAPPRERAAPTPPRPHRSLPVQALVVVVAVEELNFLERPGAGQAAGDRGVHEEEQAERRGPWWRKGPRSRRGRGQGHGEGGAEVTAREGRHSHFSRTSAIFSPFSRAAGVGPHGVAGGWQHHTMAAGPGSRGAHERTGVCSEASQLTGVRAAGLRRPRRDLPPLRSQVVGAGGASGEDRERGRRPDAGEHPEETRY